MIYLDNNTETKPCESSWKSMKALLSEGWEPFDGDHYAIKKSEQYVRGLLGVGDRGKVFFIPEPIKELMWSIYSGVTAFTGRNHFVCCKTDTKQTIDAIRRLETFDCEVGFVSINDEGYVTADDIESTITPRTALVSLSWADGMTGVVHSAVEIGKMCREKEVLFHLDVSAVLGKGYFSAEEVQADFITFSGDKIHAPPGVNVLFVAEQQKIFPEEKNINIPGIAAVGAAAYEANEKRDFVCVEVARLRDKLEEGIVKGYPEAIICFENSERLPTSSTISFYGIFGDSLNYMLRQQGIYTALGNFDNSLNGKCALNFGLSRYTTEDEIDKAIDVVTKIANQLRKASKKIIL